MTRQNASAIELNRASSLAGALGDWMHHRTINIEFAVPFGVPRVTYHNMTAGIVALHRGIKP